MLNTTTVMTIDTNMTKMATCSVLGPRPGGDITFGSIFRRGPGAELTTLSTARVRPISLARTTRGSIRTMIRVGSARRSGARAIAIHSPFCSFFNSVFKGNENNNRRHRIRAPREIKFNSKIVVSGSKCVMAGGRMVSGTSIVDIGLGSKHRCGKHMVNASPDASLTLIGVRTSRLPAVPINGSRTLGMNR